MRIRLDPLDVLFSRLVRLRAMKLVHGCERCLTWKEDYKKLQCSHFFGRRRRSVRWNEDNACGLCFSCHQHFTENPLEHTEWFKKRLGEKFELLEIQANMVGIKPDKKAIKIYLEARIKEVEKRND